MPSNESRIYVGNLPPDIRTKDIEDLEKSKQVLAKEIRGEVDY